MQVLKSSSTRNIDQYRLLHEIAPDYGKSSELMVNDLYDLCRNLKPKSILDFGCGKSNLVDAIGERLDATAYRYDPAIPQYSKLPVSSADLVINTDVLEHLDEAEVALVLADISKIGRNVFFNISIRPAQKVLPNGENAHATIRDAVWWERQVRQEFPRCIRVQSAADEVRFVTWRLPLRVYIGRRVRRGLRALLKLVK